MTRPPARPPLALLPLALLPSARLLATLLAPACLLPPLVMALSGDAGVPRRRATTVDRWTLHV
jgi:hypothetical protein